MTATPEQVAHYTQMAEESARLASEQTFTVELSFRMSIDLQAILSLRVEQCEAEMEDCERLGIDPDYWVTEAAIAVALMEVVR